MIIKKEFAILFFIIAVLFFYIFSEKAEKTHYALPEIGTVNTEEISKISIQRKETEITLTKSGDGWIIAPKNYPADPTAVNNVMRAISGLKLSALVSETKNYTIYELDRDNAITVVSYAGDKIQRTLTVGKPASSYRHTFVMVGDDHRVYHAEGNIRNEFNKTVSDFRDKIVMKFSDQIEQIIIRKGDKELNVSRTVPPASVDLTGKEPAEDEEAVPGWIAADGGPVRAEEIEKIIDAASGFRCDEFIEDKSKEDFTSPLFVLTLKGLKTYTISLFEKEDDKYPGVTSESAYPFLVSEWKAESIMKEPDSLRTGE